MLSRLGHVWFFSTTARLAQLSQPKKAEIKRRPYTVCMGDGYKVKYYKGEVLITLVLILNIIPLAVIHAVTYIYNKWLRVGCFIN